MNFSPDDVHFESATPPPSSSTIKVNGSNPATLTTGGNMTVAVANGPGSPTDWVAIYSASVPDNTPSGWVGHDDLYLNGSETTPPTTGLKSATLTFPVPSTPGAYEARFYANNSYTVITRARDQGPGPCTAAAPAAAAEPYTHRDHVISRQRDDSRQCARRYLDRDCQRHDVGRLSIRRSIDNKRHQFLCYIGA